MFSTLLCVILVSLTSCSVFAIKNCSKFHTVYEQEQSFPIPTSHKVVCYKAESKRVQLKLQLKLRLRCDWLYKNDKYWNNDDDLLHVYDGCNTTENEVKGEIIFCGRCCKHFGFCSKEIRWTSKESSCLKVIAKRSFYRKSFYTFEGKAIVDDYGDDYQDDDNERWYPCREPDWRPDPDPPRPAPPQPRPAPPQPRPAPPRRKVIKKKFIENRGVIKSPNYPDPYQTFMEYTYIIELPKTERIQLTFSEVDLPRRDNNDDCTKDYIEIYDGIASWTKKTVICGNDSYYPPIISKSYEMTIKFIADKVDGKNRGFMAFYGPYHPPTPPNVTQKVTGVVIGTACGLVFIVLTFLAICHSRKIAWLRRQYDAQSIDDNDAIEEEAPPNYDIVMSWPEKYPVTKNSSKRTQYLTGIPQNETLPTYPDLFPNVEPGHEVRSSDVSRNVDGDQFTMEENDVNESEDRDVREIDSGNDVGQTGEKENDVSKNDVKAVDVRSEVRRESNARKGSDARRRSDVKEESDARKESDARRGSDVKEESDVRGGSDAREESDVKSERNVSEDVEQESDATIGMGEYNIDVDVVKDGPDTVAYHEYSRSITTDV